MRGWAARIVVMEPAAYARWLAQPGDRHARWPRAERAVPPARLQRLPRRAAPRCSAPALEGLYGKPVPLADGRSRDRRRALSCATRSSMPRSQVAAGYEPIMPSFAGKISEDRSAQTHRLHQVARPGGDAP